MEAGKKINACPTFGCLGWKHFCFLVLEYFSLIGVGWAVMYLGMGDGRGEDIEKRNYYKNAYFSLSLFPKAVRMERERERVWASFTGSKTI